MNSMDLEEYEFFIVDDVSEQKKLVSGFNKFKLMPEYENIKKLPTMLRCILFQNYEPREYKKSWIVAKRYIMTCGLAGDMLFIKHNIYIHKTNDKIDKWQCTDIGQISFSKSCDYKDAKIQFKDFVDYSDTWYVNWEETMKKKYTDSMLYDNVRHELSQTVNNLTKLLLTLKYYDDEIILKVKNMVIDINKQLPRKIDL
jgi:hypothetical protein